MGTDASAACELCTPDKVLAETDLAYARYDNNRLSEGHVVVVPRRHVADFFAMTDEEKVAVTLLLDVAKREVEKRGTPDGYNIGVNVRRAAGQSRMHVHVHLIPRYWGDVADPRGGIKCVLPRRKRIIFSKVGSWLAKLARLREVLRALPPEHRVSLGSHDVEHVKRLICHLNKRS